jgi:hypothetical protein
MVPRLTFIPKWLAVAATEGEEWGRTSSCLKPVQRTPETTTKELVA